MKHLKNIGVIIMVKVFGNKDIKINKFNNRHHVWSKLPIRLNHVLL